jgi:hypothetical protein
MYIQWCVKGISGTNGPGNSPSGLTMQEAFWVMTSGSGIVSNWWRNQHTISPDQVATVLTDQSLDRHLHDYANFRTQTPFISLASGCVERDAILRRNSVYSAIDTALLFATDAWAHPGALFYCWVPVGHNPAVKASGVAEAVRDLNVYHRWSPYQLEGEITAKVHIPANQISRVEWWDGAQDKDQPLRTEHNHQLVDPSSLTNLRDLF